MSEEHTFEFTTGKDIADEVLGTDLVQMMKDHGRVTFTALSVKERVGRVDVVDVSYTVVFPDEA